MRTVRFSEVALSRANNFDVLRLAAASLVLVSHSFPLTGRHEPLAPHTLGTVGVEIFFAISGMLVTKSWLNEPRLGAFIRKRALRIFPALFCAVGLTALVLGPIFTTQSVPAFLASGNVARYIASNVLLFPQYVIASVFAGNPVAAANGSLWTLPVEVRAYLLLAIFALVARKERPVAISTVIVLMVCNAAFDFGESARLTTIFACSSGLYLLRSRVVLRHDVALMLLAAWAVCFETTAARPIGMVALPYVVAWLAYCTPRALRRLTAKGDASYGMYVYAFPIQQALVATFGGIGPLLLAAMALPLVWLIGIASWRLIEEPILRRKVREKPLPDAAPALAA